MGLPPPAVLRPRVPPERRGLRVAVRPGVPDLPAVTARASLEGWERGAVSPDLPLLLQDLGGLPAR